MLQIVRVKDKFNNPINGYRDLLLNVSLRDNANVAHVGELQIHLAPILTIKAEAHISYQIGRGLVPPPRPNAVHPETSAVA